MTYVEAIITRRPIVSKSGPSSSGPRMLPTENGMRKSGARWAEMPKNSPRTSVYVKKMEL